MDRTTLDKLLEIQYLKGRIDELYKGYVPNYTSTNNRIVDTRISKYENKLKETDELAYELYMIESQNSRYAKRKSKAKMSSLLSTIKDTLIDEFGCEEDNKLVTQINEQLKRY